MIIRIDHRTHYTVIRNETLRDSRLHAATRGVLTYLLSLPDDTRIDRNQIAARFPDGIRVVRGALKELVETGYLERHVTRSSKGHLVTESTLHEQPQTTAGAFRATGTGGASRTSGSRTSGKRASKLRSNKEGPAHASPPPPPEETCAACGVEADYMRADESWWCEKHYRTDLRVVGDEQG